MNPEKNIVENEQLENEEQALNEPLSQEEEDRLIQEKMREDADSREQDLSEGWNPEV